MTPAFAGAGLFRKPVPAPDQVRGRLFRDHALTQPAPQLHVERTAAAVAHVGCLESDHEIAKLGCLEPLRHQAPQHTTFAEWITPGPTRTLAGDHENDSCPLGLCRAQEMRKRVMSFALGEAMEVESAIDPLVAFGQALTQSSFKWGQGLGPRLSRHQRRT